MSATFKIVLLSFAFLGCAHTTTVCNGNAFKNVQFEVQSDYNHNKVTINGCLTPELLANPTAYALRSKHGDILELTEGSFVNLENIKELRMEGTKTTNLLPGCFKGMPNLLQIKINKCLITRIGRGVFEDTSLELVDLRKNLIEKIDIGAFSNMVNLRVLRLSENKISKWYKDWFPVSSPIRMIDMENNKLEIITEDAFVNLPKLVELNLKDNLIRDIAPGAFRHLSYLRYLILKHNQLDVIKRETSTGLTSLVKLDLSYNKICTIKDAAFQNLRNLTVLHLRNNMLQSIDKSIFAGRRMRTLDISHNQIRTLDGAFPDNFEVGFFHIAVNHLNYISDATMDHLKVGVLNYYPNPFTCACLHKFVSWINLHDVVVPRTMENCLRRSQTVCLKTDSDVCKHEPDDTITKKYLETGSMCMVHKYP